MTKRLSLFIPFAILVVMELLTFENIYTLAGMDMLEAGYLGIQNVFFIFPIMFLIYGIYCGRYAKESILSIVITFIMFMIIVLTSYVKFIALELCLISVPIFISAFLITKIISNKIYTKAK